MKRFLILFIILIMFCSVCLWYQFNGYRYGYADTSGKVVVPIKYQFVRVYDSQLDRIYFGNEKVIYVGGSFIKGSDYYDKDGFMFKSRTPVDDQIGNLRFEFNNKTFFKDKLISRKCVTGWNSYDPDCKPYIKVTARGNSRDYQKYANFLNYETGEFLFPKFSLIDYRNGFFIVENKDNNEIYDRDGKKLDTVCANLVVDNVFGDVYIGHIFDKSLNSHKKIGQSCLADYDGVNNNHYLYSKDGKRVNETLFKSYTIYNNKLYVVSQTGKPLIYNKEKNVFEDTDTDYLKVSGFEPCVFVHQNNKFGVIIGDFKSDVIYDSVIKYVKDKNACLVKQGDKYGFIGPNVNIPCIYTSIYPHNGLYVASKKDASGFVTDFYSSEKSIINYYKSDTENINYNSLSDNNNTLTVLDPSGKELIPSQYTNIYVFDKYIYATNDRKEDVDKKYYHIYDKKGNLVKSLSYGIKELNKGVIAEDKKILYDAYGVFIDINTLKTYKSPKDYVIAQNPDNELLKDCDIMPNSRYGFRISYKK